MRCRNKKTDNGLERRIHQNGYATQMELEELKKTMGRNVQRIGTTKDYQPSNRRTKL